jgi:hypothetical protein
VQHERKGEEEEKSRAGARRSRLKLIALLALASTAHAGDETGQLGIGMEARGARWPSTVPKGWYLRRDRNDLGESAVEVKASCATGARNAVRTRVQVGPGSRAALELLVPLGGTYMNGFQVQLRCDTDSAYFGDTVGSNSTNPAFHPVLLLSAVAPETGAVERWSEQLSTTSIEGMRGRHMVSVTTVPPTGAPADVDVAYASFDGMPRNHGAYSSLDLVVLDASRGTPSEASPAARRPRTGGDPLRDGGTRAAYGGAELAAGWSRANRASRRGQRAAAGSGVCPPAPGASTAAGMWSGRRTSWARTAASPRSRVAGAATR